MRADRTAALEKWRNDTAKFEAEKDAAREAGDDAAAKEAIEKSFVRFEAHVKESGAFVRAEKKWKADEAAAAERATPAEKAIKKAADEAVAAEAME